MNFLESVETCFKKYVDFNGRASRSEFWWFYLFWIIAYIVSAMIDPILILLVILGLLLPYITVTARRLHDINKTGWLQLIVLIPLVGPIIMLVFCVTEGDKKRNQYGAPIKFKRR